MTSADIIEEVEKTIGYHFHNQALLEQAFTRKSYSAEQGGEDNEVLEFYGDSVLNFIVTKFLNSKFGGLTKDQEFCSQYNESELTNLRKKLVCKETLAERAAFLDLPQYLLLGNGDEKQHAEERPSVKEDLFEAIIGAVAVDSAYDIKTLTSVVTTMLDPQYYLGNGFDSSEDAVSELQEWYLRKGYGYPDYRFRGGILCITGESVECSLILPECNKSFSELGVSQAWAKQKLAGSVLDYLDDQGLLADPNDVVPNPSKENAISQLNQLYQHGFISEPEYVDEQIVGKDGKPAWYVELHIAGRKNYWHGSFSKKKEGHHELAYSTLLDVLGINKKD